MYGHYAIFLMVNSGRGAIDKILNSSISCPVCYFWNANSFKGDWLDINFAFFRFTFYVMSSDIVRFSLFHFLVSLEEDKSMTFSLPGCVPEDITTIIHRQTPDRYSAEV